MHRVRKESQRDRHLRTGVLSARRAARAVCPARPALLAAALAAAACAFFLAACGKPAPKTPPEDPRAAWYQLQAGSITRVPGIRAAAAAARQPWTVQERVADMAFSGGTLYLAVNGRGIAAYDPAGAPAAGKSPGGAAGAPAAGVSRGGPGAGAPAASTEGAGQFRFFYDAMIFPHRTITALIPRAGEVLAHLYFNSILNTVPGSSLPLKGFNLVSLVPAAPDYRILVTPSQEKDPQWEAVGFMPLGPEAFLIEWKQSAETETRFAYTQYQPATGSETTITRDAYMGSYIPVGSPGVSAALSALFHSCGERLAGAQMTVGTAVHFSVRSKQSPVRRIYRSGEGVSSLVVIPIFQDGSDSYALLPGGVILHQAPDGALTEMPLPALPTGFRYTDVARAGDRFVVPWEEARFTEVGAAGLLLYQAE